VFSTEFSIDSSVGRFTLPADLHSEGQATDTFGTLIYTESRSGSAMEPVEVTADSLACVVDLSETMDAEVFRAAYERIVRAKKLNKSAPPQMAGVPQIEFDWRWEARRCYPSALRLQRLQNHVVKAGALRPRRLANAALHLLLRVTYAIFMLILNALVSWADKVAGRTGASQLPRKTAPRAPSARHSQSRVHGTPSRSSASTSFPTCHKGECPLQA